MNLFVGKAHVSIGLEQRAHAKFQSLRRGEFSPPSVMVMGDTFRSGRFLRLCAFSPTFSVRGCCD